MGGDATGASMGRLVSEGPRREPSDKVIDADSVAKKRGEIAAHGRYCTDKDVHEVFTLEKKVLGTGMSGPVQLATSKLDGTKYAVKSFKKKNLTDKKRTDLKNEVEIYLTLDHPHVARLEMVFESEDDVNLVMQYMSGGELYDRLSARKQYSEQVASSTTHQMLLAVNYLHSHGVVHRDLKLENFLYENPNTDHLTLIDFGFAKFWDRSKKMEQACGSLHYVAPEVLARSYTEKADMWSLGVISYMLLLGSPPFHGKDDVVLKKIRAGKPDISSRFPKLSQVAQDFILQLLVFDPTKRMSAQAALEHGFIKDRSVPEHTPLDLDIVRSVRHYAHASHFRRATYAMMAWSLTMEHHSDLRTKFLAMDTQNKGTVKLPEFMQVLRDNYHVENHEAEKLFDKLDIDNDNEIAYTEFLAAVVHDRLRMHEDVLRKTFSRFDGESSGYFTEQDLRRLLGDSFEGEDVKEMIEEVDADHDGKVTYEEFFSYFQKDDDESEKEEEKPEQEVEETPEVERPFRRRATRRQTNREKLAEILDTNFAEHFDDCSPSAHKGKHLSLSPKRKENSGYVTGTVHAATAPPRAC
eukprot:TRINITY_DN30979_c0_g1_i1.p1 TRINITY_DN30979_c0_g1~~TRINITY_DN30979_c0_g1_i1.p1  ORF type:complete len:597 (-),score=168.36 TRINITY_DN30979_c0_g1_i1:218-1957(-)